MLIALIVACEIGFWLLLLAGLVARYVLRRDRLSAALLLATPVIDVVLLAATAVDLRGGAEATPAHALAAIYVGVALGYGTHAVAWADARFAHRFAGGPAPRKPPRHGRARGAHELSMWLRHLLAYLVGTGPMHLAVQITGDPARSEVFDQAADLWTIVLVLDFVVAVSYAVRARENSPAPVSRP